MALGAGDGLGDAFVKADVSVFAVVVSFLGHTVWRQRSLAGYSPWGHIGSDTT